MSNINSLLAAIPKLTGENYHEWKFNMQMVLRRAGSWPVISGKTEKPATNAEAWLKHSEDGLTAIGLTIASSQQAYVRDCSDGPSAWKELASVYEANNRANCISLKRQLYTFRHNNEKPIQEYVSSITTLASQLRAIGVKLEEDDVCDVLIFCLGSEYSSVATALMQQPGTLTTSEISATLVEEEGYIKGKQSRASEVEKLFKASTSCGTASSRSPIVCHRCAKEGHIARYCPASRPQEQSGDSKALLAHMEGEGKTIQLF